MNGPETSYSSPLYLQLKSEVLSYDEALKRFNETFDSYLKQSKMKQTQWALEHDININVLYNMRRRLKPMPELLLTCFRKLGYRVELETKHHFTFDPQFSAGPSLESSEAQ